jgi:hypothetical protein
MALQYSETYRNAMLDAFEDSVGTAAKLQLRTGAQPATCATADSGTLIAELTLPSDWMNDASTGSKTKLGTWTGTASSGGTPAHFRVKNSAGATTHMQGTVGQGSGDLSLDNTTITNGQTITISTFTLTAPGA